MSDIPKTYRKIRVVNKNCLNFQEQTEIIEVKTELPQGRDVLIRVHYSGIEASDILQNAGVYGPLAGAEPEPHATGRLQIGDCGSEGVGEVVAVGSQARLKVGDIVIFCGSGVSFREYLTCPDWLVFPVDGRPTAELTAIPVSAATAACGLDIKGYVQKGDRALVTGATGGTGQFAVQWLKEKYGVHVVGVCGSVEKEEKARLLGCDDTINYRSAANIDAAIKERFPRGIDIAYDGVGGPLRTALWANMATFGRMICIGSVGDDYTKPGAFFDHKLPSNSSIFQSLSCSGFFLGSLQGDSRLGSTIAEITSYLRQGRISVHLDAHCKQFSGLNDVYAAQAYIRSGQNVGKVYVSMN